MHTITHTPATRHGETASNPNQALWEKGDFTRIAQTMRASGERFVASLGIGDGTRVLDLGCGDGNTALPAAKLGAEVVGYDVARNLVEAGAARAAEAGLGNIHFVQGSASAMPDLADASFDLVVTLFGAMFAPEPEAVAREMVRVVRPGGKIVMGNWIPGHPTLIAQILRISSAYSPPPPAGFVSPMLWGKESEVLARFSAAGVPAEQVTMNEETWVFDFDGTPSQFVGLFRDYYGPTMNAFAAAAQEAKEAELQRELEELFTAQDTSIEPGRTIIPATFLLVTVSL